MKKLYEIAKDLNMKNKEVIEVAKEIGIDIKNHLNNVTEDEEKKLLEKISNRSDKKEKVKKETEIKKNKENKKEQEKNNQEQVIIRREVILKEEKEKNKNGKKTDREKVVGKIQKNTQKDYNIVYKKEENRPLTIDELFGISKPKEETKTNTKPNAKSENSKEDNITSKNTKEKGKINNSNNTKKSISNKTTSNSSNDAGNNRKNTGNTRRNNNSNNSFNKNDRKNGYNKSNSFNKNDKNFKNDRNKNDFKNIRTNSKFNTPEDDIDENEKILAERDLERKKSRQKDKEKELIKQETIGKKKVNREEDYDNFDPENLNMLIGQEGISEIIESGDIFDMYSGPVRRKKTNKEKERRKKKNIEKQEQAKLTHITIGDTITVKDLAQELKVTVADILKKLMDQGIMTTLNNSLDFETAFLIAEEYGIKVSKKKVVSYEDQLFDESEDKESELKERPPVVVIMGHVDHGKTSLLDAIRHTNKIGEEAGGITQHIGAYQVEANGKLITFLDTPGHEAFTSMRARGAKATDIAVLVVAANDGVMPQTVEAINHAKAAGIPIIVAINKIDLPGVNPERIKQEMMEYGLLAEEWGGDTMFVPISAKQGTGIDNLLDMILLQAEVLELKANPNKQAKGTVIESRLDKSKGPVVSMLVNRGMLNVGDTVIVGSSIGRIRSMKNYKGEEIEKALPSTPVEVMGITTVPEAGETFYEVSDEKTAKKLVERRQRDKREKKIGANNVVTLDNLFENISNKNIKTLNIIVKSDVIGTSEAVKKSLEKLSTDEVQIKVIHSSVGAISESDVNLAKVANAIIIGFNVRPDGIAKLDAEKEGIDIKIYSVIYDAIEDVKEAMIGMLDPVFKEQVIGTAEVRDLFKISKIGTIAGSYVTSGKVKRNAKVRVIRDNVVIKDSKIISLKIEKNDAKEVKSGFECGIQIEGFNDLELMDTLEVYEILEIKRKSLDKKKEVKIDE